ncbi:MAG: hypothetical protein HKN39_00065 [Flavobacteriales bacterium]|nr:hypothetical protein [Flavobacteriales bacterium]
MTNLKYILLMSLSITLVACTTSKSLYKKGAKLEEAGLLEEASEMYMKSLAKKNTNVNSQIALKKAGQRALNEKLDSFNKLHMLADHDDAVFEYEVAQLFHERVGNYGIKLELPSHYKDRYEISLNHHLEELYKEGVAFYENKNYAEASRKFNKISGYDQNYKDIANYQILTFAEPLYNSGKAAFDREDWRKAYGFFDQIYQKNPDFKDVAELWKTSLDNGMFPVAITRFTGAASTRDESEKIYSHIIEDINAIDNPFIKIVDRDNMDQVIEEQTLGLSGVIDESTAANVGKILGAKGLISGKILDHKVRQEGLKKKVVAAYEMYEVTVTNPDTGKEEKETRFKKTRYTEFYNKNEVVLEAQYKCISLETGEIIFSDIFEKTNMHEVHYAVFAGKAQNLVPAKGDGPTDSKADYDALQALLAANKELAKPEAIATTLYEEIGNSVAHKIEDHLDH